jgi:predicted TIM-barrel fold metal-dependent hydrolase
MATKLEVVVNPENEWRLDTPNPKGWARSARPGTANKYFICSVDSHIAPPRKLFSERIDAKYRDRLPRVEMRDDGPWIVADGLRPFRIVQPDMVAEDLLRAKSGNIEDSDADMAIRLRDMDEDGIDCEIAFPNGPAMFAYQAVDMDFAMAQFRIYNDWAVGMNKTYGERVRIVPCTATGDVELAVAEIERLAGMGVDVVSLPTQPIPGVENSKLRYNHKQFEPLWAAISAANMVMVFHVATGGDPRKATGPGGTIINRAVSHEAMVDPITAFIGAGILDRYPNLRFGCVEGGAGWLPALLDLMDETYRKHHFWVFPKLKNGMPSDYFREHGLCSFQEDRSALLLVEHYNLQNNLAWSNDYPHHEGTWPHSAQAIEREFENIKEETRAKILGLNAARFFNFKIPDNR